MAEESNNLINQIFGNDGAASDKEESRDQNQAVNAGESRPEPEQLKQERLLAGKFKSVEELEKAYQEAEKWGTQRSQETAALRRELEELRKAVAPDMTRQEQQVWRQRVQAAINRAVVEENPDDLLQLIDWMIDQKAEVKFQEKYREIYPAVEQYRFQVEVNAWLAENPEAGEHIEDMIKLIQEQPDIVTKPNWLDRTYARVLKRKIGAAQKAGAENAARTQAVKQAAAMPGVQPRQTEPPESEEEKLKKALFGDTNQKRKMFDF